VNSKAPCAEPLRFALPRRYVLQFHECAASPKLAAQADDADYAILEQGREVGLLARQLFPSGIEVDGSAGLDRAIRITKELVANPEVSAIFEGAFLYRDVVVKTDILLRRKENLWRLVEVKSTTDLKEHHAQDLEIQSYVVSHSGVSLGSIWLAHINRSYALAGETVDSRQFFVFHNLTQRIRDLQPQIESDLRSQFRVLAVPTPPDVPTGPHCIDPFTCEFFHYCNPPKPADYIGYLPRLSVSALQQLQEMGVDSIHDIPADFDLTEFQRRVCTAMQTGQPWFGEELKNEFSSLHYPLYFMDFETVNPAIPRFVGMHPYDHVPFQWSVHVQRGPGAAPEHFEFLAMDARDPRKDFISSLCDALGDAGSIIVYNQQFESQRLWELAGWVLEYAEQIRGIQRRLWDLLPVVRSHIYHPAFGGSFSLKAVLPALVPEMSYDGMEVANGQAAGLAWQAMIAANDECERDAKRRALLAYCGQDTLALVRVLEALQARCSA
jgi:predicted RecB family nuclease